MPCSRCLEGVKGLKCKHEGKHWSMRLHTLLCVILLTLVSCSPGSSKSLSLHGKPWWPLGQNVAWIEDDDPHTYDYYFQRLSESGVELVRIVLVPWGLHEGWNASGEPDENRLSELEETLQMAADYNLSVILALDIYGELRSASEDPREMLWEENPYNAVRGGDRKSTRLNSSHSSISYAVFCFKKT